MSISAAERAAWEGERPPNGPPTPGGTRCSHMVGGGMMSYRCELAMGHHEVPAEDPEPHYAGEVTVRVTNWRQWAEREWERRRFPVYVATLPGSPSQSEPTLCGLPGCDVSFAHSHGTDVVVQTEGTPEQLAHIEVTKAMEEGLDQATVRVYRLYQANRLDILAGLIHWPYDISCKGRSEEETHYQDQRCFLCRPVRVEPMKVEPPTRTRKGDQVIPDGDESLDDDQSLLIKDITERRQVGIERYGQGHRPFNGRNTVQDWYEEQLDGLVYARSIVRMAQASREDLVEAVDRAFKAQPSWSLITSHGAAEVAVDRVMGWVMGRQLDGIGPKESLQAEIFEMIKEDRRARESEDPATFDHDALTERIIDRLFE